MRQDIPESIQQSLHDLAPNALVPLYKIELRSGAIFRLSPHQEITWRGDVYEDVPCHMAGVGQNSDAKVNRPKFSFANPAGIFTRNLYNGDMDGALVTRIRVMKSDLEADLDFAVRETFRVSRIMQLGRHMAVVELRDILDGAQFKLPARAYYPPEFPHVSI